MLRKTKSSDIKRILTNLGYVSTYTAVGRAHLVQSRFDGILFNCNTQVRHGNVDFVFTAVKSSQVVGGAIGTLCKEIEIYEHRDSGKYLNYLRIKNLNQLEEILGQVYKMQERYKVQVYNSRILDI